MRALCPLVTRVSTQRLPRLSALSIRPLEVFPRHGPTSQVKTSAFSTSYDSVVVGSGCAGLTAAITMAKQGLKVLVLEKTSYLGGTTAYSGGGAWIPANKHQSAIGINDSVAGAETYLRGVMGDELYNEETERIAAFLESGPSMIEWLEANTTVKFKPMPLPDYHLDTAGASTGRAVYTEEFDGRLLGQRVRDIRYPLQGYSAFGSMQADFSHLSTLTNPFKSIRNLGFALARISRFGVDLVRYGKGTIMANGNALVGRLVHSLLQEKVEMCTDSPAVRTILDKDEGICGVEFEHKGQTIRARVNKGVVLAGGGFGRSEEASKYVPHDWSASSRGSTGDGKKIGLESGGALGKVNRSNAIFVPISLLKPRTGPVRRYPHFAMDRCKPGSIIIGPDGRRFANECEPYQEFTTRMHDLGIRKAFFIADHHFLRKYGMGMALPWPYPVTPLLRQKYLFKAQTITDLAKVIDVCPQRLNETVGQYNKNFSEGRDAEFRRGESIYDQFYGDPDVKPNPNLGPCMKPPFYALPLYPGNCGTTFGLATDKDARVLGRNGKPVRGLFAVGCDQNSIVRGTYPAGGCSIGPGMTFGYRAGMFMANEKERPV